MFKKKSLGQHFLKAPTYLQAVVDAAGIQAGDVVLEIGPGEGALTQELLKSGARVTAIEKDHRLIPILHATFDIETHNGSLQILEGDALEMDLGLTIYKVVANIPYYITGALLRKYLTSEIQPTTIVFLIQKEVAQRIARSTKESLLSLSIKVYGTPVYIKTVPRGAFVPAPEVDSAILLISDISRRHFTTPDKEKRFFELLHAGFAQKRKLLRRNLEAALPKELIEGCLEAAGIPKSARAEDVSLPNWLLLMEHSCKQQL